MALRFPARVKSATSTTGTGPYTLSEPTSAGWRSFTRAVIDGDLASGDQVGYAVIDTTVTGGPNLIEVGRGTYNDTTKVLTRDVVYQPNGAAVSWGAGTRDVIVLDLPQLAVWLIEDQAIAGVKTFSSVLRAQLGGSPFAFDGATAVIVQNSGTAGAIARLAIIAGNAGVSELSLGDTDNQYRGRIHYNHSGDVLTLYRAGAVGCSIDAGGLKDASGNPYIAFAAGTRILLASNSVPAGWSIVASLADRVILTTSTASEIDDTGGGWTISGVTIGSTTLTEAQIPAHSHGPAPNSDRYLMRATGVGAVQFALGSDGFLTTATSSTGGGGSHTHSFSQDGNWRPSYYKVGVIQKT